MGRKERATFNIIGTILAFTYMLLFSIVAAVFGIFYPLSDQVHAWRGGEAVPPRDVFWLLADKSCAATEWQDLGWHGKDLCRVDAIMISEIPKIDQIANIAFDFNVAAITAVTLLLAWRLMFFVMDV